MLQPVPPWLHVGRLLGQFQPLLSLPALLQLTSILTALFFSLILFSFSLLLSLLLSSPFFASFFSLQLSMKHPPGAWWEMVIPCGT